MALKQITKHTHLVVLLTIVLSLSSYCVNAQYLYEFGFGGGLSSYTGEVSHSPFRSPSRVGSVFFRNNLNSRFSVRFDVEKGSVSGSSGNSTRYLETYPQTFEIDHEFSTDYFAGSLLFDVNFFPFPFQNVVRSSSDITPYSFVGLGFVNYDVSYDDVNQLVVKDEVKTFLPVEKNSKALLMTLGVGMRWKFGKQWGLQAQFKASKLSKDNFDGMADPFELKSTSLHLQDWLYSSTLMLTYSFGEDIWDCNCPGGYKRKKRR